MATWGVTVPIAGHAYIEVEASNEMEAIDQAMMSIEQKHIDSWDTLMRFNRGNICYCPTPWEAVAEEIEEC